MFRLVKNMIFNSKYNGFEHFTDLSKQEVNELKYFSKCCKDIINYIYHGIESYTYEEFYPLIRSNPHKITGEKYCNNCGKECEIIFCYYL